MPPAQLSNFLATGQLSELLKTIHKYFKSDSPSVEQTDASDSASAPLQVKPSEANLKLNNLKATRAKKQNHVVFSENQFKKLKTNFNAITDKNIQGGIAKKVIDENMDKLRVTIKTTNAQIAQLQLPIVAGEQNVSALQMRMILDKDKTPLTKNNIYDPTVSGNYVLLQNLKFGERHSLKMAKNGKILRSEYSRNIDIFIKQFFYCLSIIKTNQLKASLNFKHIYIEKFRKDTTIVYQNNEQIVFLKGDDQLFFTIQKDTGIRDPTLKCPTDEEFKECVENFITIIRPCYGIYKDADHQNMENTVATLKGNLLGYASAS